MIKLVLSLTISFAASVLFAGEVSNINSFSPDTPASASKVNENFSVLINAIDDNDKRISENKTEIDALNQQVNGINTLALQKRISQSCPEGQSIRAVDEEGNVICEIIANSLVDTSTLQLKITGKCSKGSSIQQINNDGSVLCGLNTADNLELGDTDKPGSILFSNGRDPSVTINGEKGFATQLLDGEGFVKAWAKVNANGTLISCFLCEGVKRAGNGSVPGSYVVDFTPLAEMEVKGVGVQDRPRTATADSFNSPISNVGVIVTLANSSENRNMIHVTTYSAFFGNWIDNSFTVVIY